MMIYRYNITWVYDYFSGIRSHPGNQDLSVYNDLGPSLRRGYIGLQGPVPGRRVLRCWPRL